MKTMLALLLSIASAHAGDPSMAERIAHATYVPPPTALPSVSSAEWCDIVDAALANPNTDQARQAEYIATGQRMKCPHQIFLPAPKAAQQQPPTPQQWCAEAFKVLGNPAADQYLKAAVLEKARNRGCLR